jgi:hypothetical protein
LVVIFAFAAASPAAYIEEGEVRFTPFSARFRFASPRPPVFDLSGGQDYNSLECRPCLAGETISVDLWAISIRGGRPGTLDGVSYPRLGFGDTSTLLGSEFFIDAEEILLDPAREVYQVPFLLFGTLAIYEGRNDDANFLQVLEVFGGGLATIRLSRFIDPDLGVVFYRAP